MYFVYVLRSKINPEKIYTGITNNSQRRLEAFNNGESKYTSRFRPWILVSTIGFLDRNRAEEFEQYLKRGSGFAFMKKHLLPEAR